MKFFKNFNSNCLKVYFYFINIFFFFQLGFFKINLLAISFFYFNLFNDQLIFGLQHALASYYKPILILGGLLFLCGVIRINLGKNNFLLMMLGLELLMLSSIYNALVWFDASSFIVESTIDFSFIFLILTIVVCESAIGLTLIMLLSRNKNNLKMKSLNYLKD
jgi:NADH:ubiquinone oxidoreductase subunit K